MARYIDEEHLMQKLSRMIDFCEKHKVSGLTALFQVGDAIMDCPTADVVPRSEVDAIRKELARYIKRDILRRYSNDKIATAVVLQMSPESFLEKEADEIVADVERKTLEKMREA